MTDTRSGGGETKAVFVLASNHFRKCFSVNVGVWLCMENKFSGKYFQLTVKLRPLTRKINASFFCYLQIISKLTDAHRERERERERELDHTPPQTRWRDHATEIIQPRSSAPSFSLLIGAVVIDLVLIAHRHRHY